jgi:dTDP-4-amino-4,6-dideoxygalactose transaminase
MDGPRALPMLDLAPQLEALGDALERAVAGVVRSGQYILGPHVEAFEREAADYLGVAHAVGVGSGTDALVIALRSLGVGPGDEVIVPSFTFFATAEAVSLVGATPVFADIDPATCTLDPADAARRVGARTRALLPVHLYGQPADLDALVELAQSRGLWLIEDAAQAFGATWRGRRAGSFGHAAAFSFFPSKNLGAAGDAGMLVTNDAAVAERARMLRVHGSRTRYLHESIGYTARLDEIQAAVLRVKLPHLDAWNARRRSVASHYSDALRGAAGVQLPRIAPHAEHVFHQYTIRVPAGARTAVVDALAAQRIASQIYYPIPVHRAPPYAGGQLLPETERAAAEVLSLPIWPELEKSEIARVAGVLAGALAAR